METGHAGMTGQPAVGAAWTGQRGAFTDDPWGRTGPSPAKCDACALSSKAYQHCSSGGCEPEEVAVQHSLSSSTSHDCQYRVGRRDGEIR